MPPFPIVPSSFSRPFCGTVRKATLCVPVVPSVTKAYFTPNHLRGSARRPFVDYSRSHLKCPAKFLYHPVPPPGIAIGVAKHAELLKETSLYLLKIGFGGVCVALTFLAAPVIYCEPATPPAAPTNDQTQAKALPPLPPIPSPPQSSVNLYELTFGTVCGICAGVFVKKGAKVVAFALGGIFVLLQYLGSVSIVRVDWGRAAGRFENLFYTKDALGHVRPPNIASLFRWLVDFLTADFQPRASFVAGFALGLRVG